MLCMALSYKTMTLYRVFVQLHASPSPGGSSGFPWTRTLLCTGEIRSRSKPLKQPEREPTTDYITIASDLHIGVGKVMSAVRRFRPIDALYGHTPRYRSRKGAFPPQVGLRSTIFRSAESSPSGPVTEKKTGTGGR